MTGLVSWLVLSFLVPLLIGWHVWDGLKPAATPQGRARELAWASAWASAFLFMLATYIRAGM